ncbi:hypothetical protein FA13DRAFT_1722027 [Coprinellus micaceus]|uniref:Uncharacterized protein n=1 Tax=Coprinellus micaceus TaxID=71717 RepID=A0A4Y7RRX2_COPMI|nr:hypothetical protein FA13DRAFT_1722027 [Coprinellus micaceus]
MGDQVSFGLKEIIELGLKEVSGDGDCIEVPASPTEDPGLILGPKDRPSRTPKLSEPRDDSQEIAQPLRVHRRRTGSRHLVWLCRIQPNQPQWELECPIKNANFPHRTLSTLPMNNAESVGQSTPNPFMTFFLPSSAFHTQRILDELHELLLGVRAWSLQDPDGKEKRERLVELTGRCMVGMMTYGGKDAFKRSNPVRAWVRLVASHPETLLKRGEMLREQDLELINDISLLRALPVQAPEISPGSTSATKDERGNHGWPTNRDGGAKSPFIAVTQMEVDEKADEEVLGRQSGSMHFITSEENPNQDGEPSEGSFPHHSGDIAQPISEALKRKSRTPVSTADEETGESRSKRARFEDRKGEHSQEHSQGEKGERRSGETVEIKASIQNEERRESEQGIRGVRSQDGGASQENSVKPHSRKPATSQIEPRGLYAIPCDRCQGLGRDCQYIVIGRACYRCRRGKIGCKRTKGAIPGGARGVTRDKGEVNGLQGIGPKAEIAGGCYNRGESPEEIDIPPVPGIEKGVELIPRAPSIVSEGAPLIPGTVAWIPDSADTKSQTMGMDPDQEEDAAASTVNPRRSRRQQEGADKKRTEAERQRAEEEEARAEAERERARRHVEEAERRDTVLRAAAESIESLLANRNSDLTAIPPLPIQSPRPTLPLRPRLSQIGLAQSAASLLTIHNAESRPLWGMMAPSMNLLKPTSRIPNSFQGQLPALAVPAGPTLHAPSHVEARVQAIPNEATSARKGVVAPEKHFDDVIEDLLVKMQSVREWTKNIDKLMEAQSQVLMKFRNQTRNEGDQFPKAGMAPVPGSISPPMSVLASGSAFAEGPILSSPPPVSAFNAMAVSESPSTSVPQSSSSAQEIASPFSSMSNSVSAPLPLAPMSVDVPVPPTSTTQAVAAGSPRGDTGVHSTPSFASLAKSSVFDAPRPKAAKSPSRPPGRKRTNGPLGRYQPSTTTPLSTRSRARTEANGKAPNTWPVRAYLNIKTPRSGGGTTGVGWRSQTRLQAMGNSVTSTSHTEA